MSRDLESLVEERVASTLSGHKETMLKEMESMFMKISASSQNKLSNQIVSTSLSNTKFKRKSNEEQFKVNVEVLGKIEGAVTSIQRENLDESKQKLEDAKSLLQHRQKMIRLADSSELGWKVVNEYETNPLASDSEDERRIYKAEARATRKAKAERSKKSRVSRYVPYRKQSATPLPNPRMNVTEVPTATRRIPPGLCFACGKPGHWKGSPECNATNSNNKISTVPACNFNVTSIDFVSVDTLCKPAVTDEPGIPSYSEAESIKDVDTLTPVGGLRSCFPKWEEATTSEYIRNVVKEGYKLPFKEIPKKLFSQNNRSARQNPVFVMSEIKSLLKKGVISETKDVPYVVNPLTVAYGKSGKPRLVLDCRHINKHLHLFKVKFEDIKVAKQIFAENSFLFTYDLKGAYHHVDIFSEHRMYLGFSYSDGYVVKYYHFNSLPFGIRPAGHIFTKLLKVVVAYIRSYGHKVIMFLDDGIGGHTSYDLAVQSSNFVKQSVQEFGFILADEKCSWKPSRNITWLGHVLDMISNKIFITEERMSRLDLKLVSVIGQIESNIDKIVPVRFLASIVGQIISLQSVVGSLARLKTRELFKCINTRVSWNAPVKVSNEAMSELLFWRENAGSLNRKGCPLKTIKQNDFNLFVDASSIGYGGYLEPVLSAQSVQLSMNPVSTESNEFYSVNHIASDSDESFHRSPEVECGRIPDVIHCR